MPLNCFMNLSCPHFVPGHTYPNRQLGSTLRNGLHVDPDVRSIGEFRFHMSRQLVGSIFGELQAQIVHGLSCRRMDYWDVVIQFVSQFAENIRRTRRASGRANSERQASRTRKDDHCTSRHSYNPRRVILSPSFHHG